MSDQHAASSTPGKAPRSTASNGGSGSGQRGRQARQGRANASNGSGVSNVVGAAGTEDPLEQPDQGAPHEHESSVSQALTLGGAVSMDADDAAVEAAALAEVARLAAETAAANQRQEADEHAGLARVAAAAEGERAGDVAAAAAPARDTTFGGIAANKEEAALLESKMGRLAKGFKARKASAAAAGGNEAAEAAAAAEAERLRKEAEEAARRQAEEEEAAIEAAARAEVARIAAAAAEADRLRREAEDAARRQAEEEEAAIEAATRAEFARIAAETEAERRRKEAEATAAAEAERLRVEAEEAARRQAEEEDAAIEAAARAEVARIAAEVEAERERKEAEAAAAEAERARKAAEAAANAEAERRRKEADAAAAEEAERKRRQAEAEADAEAALRIAAARRAAADAEATRMAQEAAAAEEKRIADAAAAEAARKEDAARRMKERVEQRVKEELLRLQQQQAAAAQAAATAEAAAATPQALSRPAVSSPIPSLAVPFPSDRTPVSLGGSMNNVLSATATAAAAAAGAAPPIAVAAAATDTDTGASTVITGAKSEASTERRTSEVPDGDDASASDGVRSEDDQETSEGSISFQPSGTTTPANYSFAEGATRASVTPPGGDPSGDPGDHGIFAPPSQSGPCDLASAESEVFSCGDFEAVLRQEKLSGSALAMSDPLVPVSVIYCTTKREDGRCLRPAAHEEPRIATGTAASLQLAFFAAQQTLIGLPSNTGAGAAPASTTRGGNTASGSHAPAAAPAVAVANREPKLRPGDRRLPLSAARLSFEKLPSGSVTGGHFSGSVASTGTTPGTPGPSKAAQNTASGTFAAPAVAAVAAAAAAAKREVSSILLAGEGDESDPEDSGGDVDDEASVGREDAQAATLTGFVTPQSLRATPDRALQALFDGISFPDPMQSWERARNRPAPPPLPSSHKLWTADYEPKKSLPAASMFTGGILYQVTLRSFTTTLHQLHGSDVDPLFGTVALHSIGTSGQPSQKISETFYFDTAIEGFFRHKPTFPTQRLKSFVTFIPNEVKAHNVYMLVRVFRLACENHDEGVDMYLRPDRYKIQHIVPIKQKTLLLAEQSEVVQELGWYASQILERSKLFQGEGIIDKLYQSPKNLSDASTYELVLNEPRRSALKIVPVRIHFDLLDVSSYEVSVAHHKVDVTSAIEEEAMLSIVNPEQLNAARQSVRYCPSTLPVLTSGYFTSFTNVMYVRLQSLLFSKGAPTSRLSLPSIPLLGGGAGQMKTLVVQVALRDNDDAVDDSGLGLPAVFGRSLCSSIVDRCGWATASYMQKDVEFGDEFKIQLPVDLTDRHHLFITVWSVVFYRNAAAGGALHQGTRVGFAVLPIFPSGALVARDKIELPLMTVEAMQGMRTNYLSRMSQLTPMAYHNAGQPILTFGTVVRSTVHVSNAKLASVFAKMPPCLREVTRDDNVFSTSGQMLATQPVMAMDQNVLTLLAACADLPLAELMAFYPMLTNFILSIVATKSSTVGFAPRRAAFRTFVNLSSTVHQWENSKKLPKPAPGAAAQRFIVRTTVMAYIYHYMTNEIPLGCVEARSFPLHAAIVEVWLAELDQQYNSSEERTYVVRMTEMAAMLFDIILKSLYLRSHKLRVEKSFIALHPSFYELLKKLLIRLNERLATHGGQQLLLRSVFFLRHLLRVCDRGAVLRIIDSLLTSVASKPQTPPQNVVAALKALLEFDQAVLLALPSPNARRPRFLLDVCLAALLPLLINKLREIRVSAAAVLYNFIFGAVNDARLASADLATLGAAMLDVVDFLAQNWGKYRAATEKDGILMTMDRRQLLSSVLWCLYRQPEHAVRQWFAKLSAACEFRAIAGFLTLMADAVQAFRFQAGRDKQDAAAISPQLANKEGPPVWEVTETMAMDDGRHATLVTLLGIQVCSLCLDELIPVLQTVKEGRPNIVVGNFFMLLETCLNLQSSHTALEAGAALLHKTNVRLFPELVSRKARNSSGMVLLTFRLMSCRSRAIRMLAAETFLDTARRYHVFFGGSLSKLRHLTVASLVSVAESPGRVMTRAGQHIGSRFRALCAQARRAENALAASAAAGGSTGSSNTAAPPPATYPASYLARYEAGSAADEAAVDAASAAASAATAGTAPVVTRPVRAAVFTSVVSGFADGGGDGDAPPCAASHGGRNGGSVSSPTKNTSFAAQLTTICEDANVLFGDVVRLQVDSGMKLKDAKAVAIRSIVDTFLSQNCLTEAIKWLGRLMDAHKAAGDFLEAGLTGVFVAAVGYRVAEGIITLRNASGDASTAGGRCGNGAATAAATTTTTTTTTTAKAAIGPTFLQHVFWHDYVRILPELEATLGSGSERLRTIVGDLFGLPGDACFTVDGQVQLLKDAAESFGRCHWFEYSLLTIRIVATIVAAQGDFRSEGVVATAVGQWANAIASSLHAQPAAPAAGAPGSGGAAGDTAGYAVATPLPRRLACKFWYFRAEGDPLTTPVKRIFRTGAATTAAEFKTFAQMYATALVDSALAAAPAKRAGAGAAVPSLASTMVAGAVPATVGGVAASPQSADDRLYWDDGGTIAAVSLVSPIPAFSPLGATSGGGAAHILSRMASSIATRAGASAAAAAAGKAAPLPPWAGRCLVTCYEVTAAPAPPLERAASANAAGKVGGGGGGSAGPTPDNPCAPHAHLATVANIGRFRRALVVHADTQQPVSGVAPAAAGAAATAASAAAAWDVGRHQTRNVIHTTAGAFPTLVTSLPVLSTEEAVVGAVGTALDAIAAAAEQVDAAPAATPSADLFLALRRALTPLELQPPGRYFREAIRALAAPADGAPAAARADAQRVAKAAAQLLQRVKVRLAQGGRDAPADVQAQLMKATIDMECALEAVGVAAVAAPLPTPSSPITAPPPRAQ